MRREHERLLAEWTRAGLALRRTAALLDGLQALVGFGLAIAIISVAWRASGAEGGLLLLAYWTLTLPVLGEELALAVRRLPRQRNLAVRALEPLEAIEDRSTARPVDSSERSRIKGDRRIESAMPTVAPQIAIHGVSVHVRGQAILQDIDLDLAPGTHLAVVGTSGAGKSTLLGLLLGFHEPHAGEVLADGVLLTGSQLASLRRRSAWIDPTVRLWNHAMIDNLRYGSSRGANDRVLGWLLAASGLHELLEQLPEGLATLLGDGGGLVSGGEGQRVRLGRALHRLDAGLVLMDEPFRGLDREARRSARRRAPGCGPVGRDAVAPAAHGRRALAIITRGAPVSRPSNPLRYAAIYGLWALSWTLFGRGLLDGRLQGGWLVAWALLLATLVPLRGLATFWAGTIAIETAAALKQRLMVGTLATDPDAMRAEGLGQLLGRVFASEAVESLALGGGFVAMFSLIEIVLAGGVLTAGAAGGWHALALVCWLGFAVPLARSWAKARADWCARRLSMTHGLVERMLGHATRLAQQSPDCGLDQEDRELARYVLNSAARIHPARSPR